MTVRVEHGDCLEVMRRLAAEGVKVDAVVTDPPYHLASFVRRFDAADAAPARSDGATGVYARGSRGFMGQQWDGGDIAFRPETWALALDLLQPGGHLVAFGAPKNSHRLACAIEDAGFEIRDALLDLVAADAAAQRFIASLDEAQADAFSRVVADSSFGGLLAWVFASGFPKSLDVAKALDKAAGHEGEYGEAKSAAHAGWISRGRMRGDNSEAGWQRPWMTDPSQVGKNARQYIPATDAARQWAGWGTGMKPAYEPIILARKPLAAGSVAAQVLATGTGALNIDVCRVGTTNDGMTPDVGRWPANVLHDGSPEVLEAFAAYGERQGRTPRMLRRGATTGRGMGYHGAAAADEGEMVGYADVGTAARFFFSAKADAEDRWGSKHPTVKPIALMRWLVRLVTPPGGVVLDPFAGSGSTGVAALAEGMDAILIEREAAYVADICARLDHYSGTGGHSLAVKARHADAPAKPLPLFSGDGTGRDDGVRS